MANAAETIDHITLEKLVEAGAVRGACVVGHAGGWGVVIQYGMTERVLAARRGAVRVFRKFETLVGYLKDLGISQFSVNAADFDVATLKTSRVRPDASERMKKAFEAKEHSDWVQEKVAASLADLRPNVSHQQAMMDIQAMIDQKRKLHAAKTNA